MAVIMAVTLVWYGVDMAGTGKGNEPAAYPLVYQEVGPMGR
jgi:hypothetical protein